MTKRKRRLKIKRIVVLSIFIGLFVVGGIKASMLIMGMLEKDDEESNIVIGSNIQDNGNRKHMDSENDIKYKDDEIYNKLKEMANEEDRMKTILNTYEDYPHQLLEMLTRNIEMLDFVLGYPKEKGRVYDYTIKNVVQDEIPLLLQWDKRWGYGNYGDGIMAVTGCAPTALSMVLVGLTGDPTITPTQIANYAESNGFYVEGSGSSWQLITSAAITYGVYADELSLSQNSIMNCLDSGYPIICSMRSGDFTTTGHFIVLVGTKKGKINVHDPNSKERSSKLWDYQTLEKQINNLWAFHL